MDGMKFVKTYLKNAWDTRPDADLPYVYRTSIVHCSRLLVSILAPEDPNHDPNRTAARRSPRIRAASLHPSQTNEQCQHPITLAWHYPFARLITVALS